MQVHSTFIHSRLEITQISVNKQTININYSLSLEHYSAKKGNKLPIDTTQMSIKSNEQKNPDTQEHTLCKSMYTEFQNSKTNL